MACIIRMTSVEFLDKFIKKHDYKKFNFLLISEDIKTTNQYKNVYAIPSLIPPPNIISDYITGDGYSEKYIKNYLDYIQTPRVEAMITVAVKLAIIDNANVVLICSKAENEFKYIDIICQYIENIYGVKTYSYKKYKKDPKACETVDDKVKKKVSKILEKKIGEIQDIDPYKIPHKKQIREFVKCLGKKEMTKLLRTNGIKHNPKDSKKDLKKLLSNMIAEGRVRV